MPEAPFSDDAELAAIFARLRDEVRAARPTAAPEDARQEAERLWPVAVRVRSRGGWRSALDRPLRAYLEPVLAEQREFNAAVLRLVDELGARLEQVEERVGRLERAR
jgi:hypothetical protein